MPTALIIGASRGLGRALVQEHLQRGWSVIATVRDARALAEIAQERLEVELLDVTDRAGGVALAAKLAGRNLDLLFVNAGVSFDPHTPIGAVDPATFAKLLDTNALGPIQLIEQLLPCCRADATVAVMSSGLGSVAGNHTGGWEAYRMSKAALNMGLKSLETRDPGSHTWLAIAPGWVRTDMGGPGATFSIEESIPKVVDVLEQTRESGGCRFLDRFGKELPW